MIVSNLSLQLSEVRLQLLLLCQHLLRRAAADQVIEEITRHVWNEEKTLDFDQLSWEQVSIRLCVSQRVCVAAADAGCFGAGAWVNVQRSALTASPDFHTHTNTRADVV